MVKVQSLLMISRGMAKIYACQKTIISFLGIYLTLVLVTEVTIIIFTCDHCTLKLAALIVSPLANFTTKITRFQKLLPNVSFDGTWKYHITELQNQLKTLRINILKNSSYKKTDWKIALKNASFITGKDVAFSFKLRHKLGKNFLNLNWYQRNNASDQVLPVHDRYYKPFASQPACDYYEHFYYSQLQWYDQWKLQISCNTSSFHLHTSSVSLQKIFDGPTNELAHHTSWTYSNSSEFSSYIGVVINAYVNPIGSIANSDLIIHPLNCYEDEIDAVFATSEAVATVDEVFVISQTWGDGHFYMNAKNLPRLALYTEFLQTHPNIYIHMASGDPVSNRWQRHAEESLRTLGIHPKRILRGNVRARIAYLPRSSICEHMLLLPEIQVLASRYHHFIQKNLFETEHSSLVLIVRDSPSGNRNIPRETYNKLIQQLQHLVSESSLSLELFDDRNNPTYYDTIRMFYRAKIIIGMHGAGLVNMIYSPPGAQVIEMMCQPPINVNFATIAGILGHRYHAFPVNGCPRNVTVGINHLVKVISTYIS